MHGKRVLISFLTAFFISCVVFLTLNDYGITWDESINFYKSDQYVSWLMGASEKPKDEVFRIQNEDIHPPFRKIVAGFTHTIFTERFHILDNTRGYRISSLVFVFPFVFAYTYIAIGIFGFFFGVFAACIFSFLPHVLFLTSLVTLDYAVAVLWFFAIIFSIKGSRHFTWATAAGVCVGLALLTKLHGFLIFIPLSLYWIYCIGKLFGNKKTRKEIYGYVIRYCYLVAVSVFIYVLGWPWLWTSPISNFLEYIKTQFVHVPAESYIFHTVYAAAPWWYTPVMFLSTTPAFVLIFFVFGAIGVIKKGSVWLRVILANALFPLLFFSLPSIYRYDWIRLFLASFPFVCLISVYGMNSAVKLFKPDKRKIGKILLLSIWIVTVYMSVIRIHPWESSYYNEFVGGIRGANIMGFETEYWGNAYKAVLPWMNEHKKEMMCVAPTTNPFYYYQAMGQIESGVVFNAGIGACRYLVVLMRQGLLDQNQFVSTIIATQKPIYTHSVDGVTLIGVYDINGVK